MDGSGFPRKNAGKKAANVPECRLAFPSEPDIFPGKSGTAHDSLTAFFRASILSCPPSSSREAMCPQSQNPAKFRAKNLFSAAKSGQSVPNKLSGTKHGLRQCIAPKWRGGRSVFSGVLEGACPQFSGLCFPRICGEKCEVGLRALFRFCEGYVRSHFLGEIGSIGTVRRFSTGKFWK